MPVNSVGSGSGSPSVIDNYSIGANATAKQRAETLATEAKLTDAEKAALLLKKINEGQRTDKAQTTKADPTKLGKDDFMRLMLATLKYQDPSQPMDTAQLLQQTSTMTNMEQMIQMTEASKKSFEAQQHVQGASMVGKTAVYDAVDAEGNPVTTAGKIDAVEFLAEGEVMVHIGKTKVKMSEILGIADPSEDPKLSATVEGAVRQAQENAKPEAAAAAAADPETASPRTGEETGARSPQTNETNQNQGA